MALLDCLSMASSIRPFSTTTRLFSHFKLAIVGGGSGGSAISNMFASSLGKKNVAVIEPEEHHYYQPLWTLVGAGAKTLEQSKTPMSKVLNTSTWIKDRVSQFQPDKNVLVLGSGDQITYDFLVVAMGLECRYDLVKGLEEGLKNYPEVCTNYDKQYVEKTYKTLQSFDRGVCLFTMNTPIKCPGAPQKIMYLAEDYFTQRGKRKGIRIIYATMAGHMLGPKKYADALYGICQKRGIDVNFFTKLVEIDPRQKVATFDILDSKEMKPTGEKRKIEYDMIHVGPPFSSPRVLRQCTSITDSAGWLAVDKHTLQSTAFKNIFGIGDCTNLPNSKTAAAVAAEAGVVKKNLRSVLENKQPTARYNGYSSCPIPTSYKSAILAEFDYDLNPLETFPIDQSKERLLFYYVKSSLVPLLYWRGLVRGIWEGPATVRKLLRLGFA